MVDVEAVCRRLMQYGYDGFAVFEQLEEQKESKDMLNDVLQSMMR